MSKIAYWEWYELAAVCCGLNPEVEDDALEQSVFDKFGIDLDAFCKVAEALLPLAMVAESSLTKQPFQGFAKAGLFVVKQPFNQETKA